MASDQEIFALYSRLYENRREIELTLEDFLGIFCDDPSYHAGARPGVPEFGQCILSPARDRWLERLNAGLLQPTRPSAAPAPVSDRRSTDEPSHRLGASTMLDGGAGAAFLAFIQANPTVAILVASAVAGTVTAYIHYRKWLEDRREKLRSEFASAKDILRSMEAIVKRFRQAGTWAVVQDKALWRRVDEAYRFIQNARRILRSPREWRRILPKEDRETVATFVDVLRRVRRDVDLAIRYLPRPRAPFRISLP